MSLIIETGAGVRNANAYVNIAYVTAYLTARNRQTENSWSTSTSTIQEAAIVAATDYIDKKFGPRFKGLPSVVFDETYATASLNFTGIPGANETLVLGDDTYKFVTSLSGAAYEVLRGASGALTAANLEAAINGVAGAGVAYGLGTPQSRHSTATLAGVVLTLTAKAQGSSGALTVLQGPATNVTTNQFSGGSDGGLQPLCWPRTSAYDQQGNEILGIPDKLKQAVSEYAVRAVAESLLPDPTVDPYAGRVSQRTETVGPIIESVKYDSGTVGTMTFTPYPSADKLLTSLLLGSGSGGVIRG
jgi:hypothetical protein